MYDKRILAISAIAATMINIGVMVKNGMDQAGKANAASKALGMVFFVVGWFIMAVVTGAVGASPAKLLLSFVATVLIVVGVILVKEVKNLSMIGGPLFMIGWVLFGIVVGLGKPTMGKTFGFVAAALVLISMVVVLPKQRKDKVVDGPGMGMFTLAWVLISMTNAMHGQGGMV